jgi:hypothetical protein
VADRDLLARLPEVELADLPGPVDGALVGAPGGEVRPDLAQVVVEDRLASFVAQLCDQLADASIETPSTKCNRLISAQCSTLITRSSSP